MVKQNIPPQPQARAAPVSAPQQIAQQGVTTVQTRPTDINIPHSIDKIVPEVSLYRKLLDAEKKIDIFTARKINDLQENINKIPTKKEILRIFIFNTAENQPWQLNQGQQSNEEPTWNLRIEGRLVNDVDAEDPQRRKFSTFLNGISIDIQNDKSPQSQQQQPNQQDLNKENVIEWHEQTDPNAPKVEFDGLDVKRPGSQNIKTKITIQPKESPIKLITSNELSSLLGVNELTQHDAVYSIWQYIQFNNLQAPEDKRIINCDENLSKLFNVPRFNFRDLIELLSKHLSPKPPIEINYEIKVDKSSTLGETVIDVEVPFIDVSEQEYWKNESKKLLTENDESIKELNMKIILGIQALNNSNRKYQFYNLLTQDPVQFLKDFTQSHSELLKILSGDEGYNEDTVRRSEFYTDELLSENVDLLLKTNRI
ncbi:hypothetical protein BN7_6512 [Wickerhamomyces ciferrii]|uniref:DM2 domain-containing protein n=1 Tax=Wickerhamomyces ciferrii (strain ATCC 14091 / BCRC 22168 / CBS 111 / JCM 3599 / NBRC 0793 / NRRL Y-1031 F-60-10) TaxID=1206466 RepID=K0KXW4_WICCF|nr:uncharacterized protein BN7_6512 [Wickerhamomyces ciferrii]CCH46907.1 hypothetical protein BN7_6512 [Wickerhamomyces ciferrii]